MVRKAELSESFLLARDRFQAPGGCPEAHLGPSHVDNYLFSLFYTVRLTLQIRSTERRTVIAIDEIEQTLRIHYV